MSAISLSSKVRMGLSVAKVAAHVNVWSVDDHWTKAIYVEIYEKFGSCLLMTVLDFLLYFFFFFVQ